jgi:hypothetical protein
LVPPTSPWNTHGKCMIGVRNYTEAAISPTLPFSKEIQMVKRDALATPQPHGLHLGSSGAHVPLPSESENPQRPVGPVTQIDQPLGHPPPPSPILESTLLTTTELFGSPLNCSMLDGNTYFSAFPEDAIFGTVINSFQFRWPISCLAN